MSGRGGSVDGIGLEGAEKQERDMLTDNIQLQNAMESCFVKTGMSGVAGFGLGGVFGIFMASVS